MRSTFWLVGVLSLVIVAPAAAQEKGQVGLTMGYPAAVGIVWHAADRVAIRPEFVFNRATNEVTQIYTILIINQLQTQETTRSITTQQVGAGVSGLLYVSKRDNLGVYVSPRYTYSRASFDQSGLSTVSSSGSITTTHGVSGSLGAEYAMTDALEDNAASLGVSRALGYQPNGFDVLVHARGTDTLVRLRLAREAWRQATPFAPVTVDGLEAALPYFGI